MAHRRLIKIDGKEFAAVLCGERRIKPHPDFPADSLVNIWIGDDRLGNVSFLIDHPSFEATLDAKLWPVVNLETEPIGGQSYRGYQLL